MSFSSYSNRKKKRKMLRQNHVASRRWLATLSSKGLQKQYRCLILEGLLNTPPSNNYTPFVRFTLKQTLVVNSACKCQLTMHCVVRYSTFFFFFLLVICHVLKYLIYVHAGYSRTKPLIHIRHDWMSKLAVFVHLCSIPGAGPNFQLFETHRTWS